MKVEQGLAYYHCADC